MKDSNKPVFIFVVAVVCLAAGIKISEMQQLTNLANDDRIPVYDSSETGTNANKTIRYDNFKSNIVAGLQTGSENLTNFSSLSTNSFHRVAAGSGITTTTNNGTVTVAASGSSPANLLTTNVILGYTAVTNVLVDFNAAPCFGTNSQANYWHTVTTNSYFIFTNIPAGLTNWEFNLQIKYTTNIYTVIFDTNTIKFPSGIVFQPTQNSNKVDLVTGIKSILTNSMNVTYANDFTR